MKRIDLNCDMGEMPEAVADGTQESLMSHLTSVNIACGGHAGDPLMMQRTIEQALRWHVAIGAHPGYPDRANFGRVELAIPRGAIADVVFEQVRTLAEIAAGCGATIGHVKPHGALYNQAAQDCEIAQALADGVARWRKDLVLIGLAGSQMLEVFRRAGFRVAAEAFADRRYEFNGRLRSRKFDDALIVDANEAARQALQIVEGRKVLSIGGKEIPLDAETICIHGDMPGASQIAAAVTHSLRSAGIELKPLRE
ncbi:MAG TPA: 5-oxoprolinase subunit PxpA [Candidatus Acidoferrales bacterium]|nr:5-oxoprolinase subunit PxpA [Candidatus Acidoferrales bacterium]